MVKMMKIAKKKSTESNYMVWSWEANLANKTLSYYSWLETKLWIVYRFFQSFLGTISRHLFFKASSTNHLFVVLDLSWKTLT